MGKVAALSESQRECCVLTWEFYRWPQVSGQNHTKRKTDSLQLFKMESLEPSFKRKHRESDQPSQSEGIVTAEHQTKLRPACVWGPSWLLELHAHEAALMLGDGPHFSCVFRMVFPIKTSLLITAGKKNLPVIGTNLVLSWKPPKSINCLFQATIRCPLRPEGPPGDLKF